MAVLAWVSYKTHVYVDPAAGYPLLMILVLGGVRLVAIGLLGQYLGRVFNEVKQRLRYLLNSFEFSDLAAMGVWRADSEAHFDAGRDALHR